MSSIYKFIDSDLMPADWLGYLEKLVESGLVSWSDIAAITLGHLNPSQVGTSLASSEGFKRKYGKGKVMRVVIPWLYKQAGKCLDCGTRLDLQADHEKPREEYDNPLDADFIENIVLRCRRHNVIKRKSHENGGKTHLTVRTALMWILFTFHPRTLSDFIRMCRLYGMTMADVRMQEGWAMAHWLKNSNELPYSLDTETTPCQILSWPDGSVTRCWEHDKVPNKAAATVVFKKAYPAQCLIVLAHTSPDNDSKVRVQAIKYKVDTIPFSHYFQDGEGNQLAITYKPPKKKTKSDLTDLDRTLDDTSVEDDTLAQMSEEATMVETPEVADLDDGATINLMAPAGMKRLAMELLSSDVDAEICWNRTRKAKPFIIAAGSRGKKVCDLPLASLATADFRIVKSKK